MLRKGVDSLYLSARGQVVSEWHARLARAKALAGAEREADQALAQVDIAGVSFEVLPRRTKLHAYVLNNAAFNIKLAGPSAKQTPVCYVQIKSGYLTACGVENAVQRLSQVVGAVAVLDGAFSVSRVDLFADFVAPYALGDWSRTAWVGRSRKVGNYWDGVLCTGWTIGAGGALSARMYDKTKELEKSRKDYLLPLWTAAGWDAEQPVTRLEFQFQSESLRELGVRDYGELLPRAGALWRYAMEDWLRLCIPSDSDGKRDRWPVHPLWSWLAAVDWPATEVVTRRPRPPARPADSLLIGQYIAALSSYMAATGLTDPLAAMEQLHGRAQAFHDQRQAATGEDFESFLTARAANKAKRWGIPYAHYPVRAAGVQAQAAADAYRRAKDGR